MNRSPLPIHFAMRRGRLLGHAALLATLALSSLNSMGNVLTNPGFETDAVLNNPPVGGATDWTTSGNANTASSTNDPVRTGTGSLQLAGGGGFGVPQAYQTFAATNGQTWNFQGYMLTTTPLPADATFGLLKIVWRDINGNELQPVSAVVGTANNGANPGVESTPFLNSGSTTNSWIFTRASGVAPAGTAEVRLYALMVDQSAGTGYFDDLDATNAAPVGPPVVIINYPTNNAPTPTRPSATVLSMYNSSSTYTDHGGINWYAGWSGNPGGNADFTITNTGAVVKKYLGMGYAGVEFYNPNMVDATPYNTLHVDVWTPNANQFGIQLVSLATGTQAGQVNITPASGTITTNHWVSLDIPLSQFTDVNPNLLLNNIEQLLWIDNQGGGVVNGNFYIDNVYFYSNSVVPPVVINYPTNNAPTPTKPSATVLSMYNSSGTYTDHGGINWYAGWSGNPGGNADFTITNTGAVVKKYLGLSFAGVEFYNPNQIDASAYTTLHVDVWSPNANQFGIQLVSLSTGTQAGQVNLFPAGGAITTNHWVSLDIPLTQFTAANPNLLLNNIEQLLWIDNQAGGGVVNGNFYIDNVYFYASAAAPTLTSPAVSGGNFTAKATSQTGFSYVLQGTTSLNPPTWSNLQTNVGTGGILNFSVPVTTGVPQRFFRVQVQ